VCFFFSTLCLHLMDSSPVNDEAINLFESSTEISTTTPDVDNTTLPETKKYQWMSYESHQGKELLPNGAVELKFGIYGTDNYVIRSRNALGEISIGKYFTFNKEAKVHNNDCEYHIDSFEVCWSLE
jgi:hypothetical protein